MRHSAFWRRFYAESPLPTTPPPISMLEADGNAIDEFTGVFASIYHHSKGERGHSAVTRNSLIAGKASFDVKTHLSQRVLSGTVA